MHPAGYGARLAALATAWLASGCDHPDVDTGAVLTPDLALIGSSFAETLTDAQGRVTEERGFFSGLAERREGAWRLRSAHWSSLRPRP